MDATFETLRSRDDFLLLDLYYEKLRTFDKASYLISMRLWGHFFASSPLLHCCLACPLTIIRNLK